MAWLSLMLMILHDQTAIPTCTLLLDDLCHHCWHCYLLGDGMLMPKMQPLSCMLLLPPSFRKPPHLLTSQLAAHQSCSPLATFPCMLSQQPWLGVDSSHSL